MLKAITFDFWQTLYADSHENWMRRQAVRVDKCHDYLRGRGYACDVPGVQSALSAAYELTHVRWHRHVGVPVAVGMQELASALDFTLDAEEIAALVSVMGASFLASPPRLIPHVKPVLERLSAKYPLGIVSDSALTPGMFVRKLMERDGLLHCFQAFTFSDETAHTKPEVAQFHATLAHLGVEPAEAVHIGDIFRTDIVGAKNAGMKAIRFCGFNRSERNDTLSDAVVDDYRELEEAIFSLFAMRLDSALAQ